MPADGNRSGRQTPANDNTPPDGQDARAEADASERLDAVVLSIARLIGRRMARADFEAARSAANDNAAPECDEPAEEDS